MPVITGPSRPCPSTAYERDESCKFRVADDRRLAASLTAQIAYRHNPRVVLTDVSDQVREATVRPIKVEIIQPFDHRRELDDLHIAESPRRLAGKGGRWDNEDIVFNYGDCDD